jgi:nucleotide-binding universal stress UspA family protein
MFRSIVVPLDLEAGGDRALPFAGALAVQARLPLELITVSSPAMAEELDLYELAQRARSTGAACTSRVLHDNDVAGRILSFVADQPDPLVVMATRARGPLSEQFLGSVSEAVLAGTDRPVLLIGPKAVVGDPRARATLVVGVAGSTTAEIATPAISSWLATFGGPSPWLVGVMPPETADADLGDVYESSSVHRLADRLAAKGIESEWDIAHAKRPTEGLTDFADHVADAVLVVASSRWTDPQHTHFTSVARKLTHRAHHPVLVVPAERARVVTG